MTEREHPIDEIAAILGSTPIQTFSAFVEAISPEVYGATLQSDIDHRLRASPQLAERVFSEPDLEDGIAIEETQSMVARVLEVGRDLIDRG